MAFSARGPWLVGSFAQLPTGEVGKVVSISAASAELEIWGPHPNPPPDYLVWPAPTGLRVTVPDGGATRTVRPAPTPTPERAARDSAHWEAEYWAGEDDGWPVL